MLKPTNDCFKTRTHELTYILTKMQSYHRLQALQITPEHYNNRTLASDWYRQVHHELVNTDERPTDHTLALITLEELYSAMKVRQTPVFSVV